MLVNILKARFEAFPERHPDISWDEVKKGWTPSRKNALLQMMEDSGGQPDGGGVTLTTGTSSSWTAPRKARRPAQPLL